MNGKSLILSIIFCINLLSAQELSTPINHIKKATYVLWKKIQKNPSLKKQFTLKQLVDTRRGSPRINGLTWHHSQQKGLLQQANLFSNGKVIKTKKLKDKGQYNTCPHECNYCYANTSKEIAKKNYRLYLGNLNDYKLRIKAKNEK